VQEVEDQAELGHLHTANGDWQQALDKFHLKLATSVAVAVVLVSQVMELVVWVGVDWVSLAQLIAAPQTQVAVEAQDTQQALGVMVVQE
jgi:hypothetical protein